MGRFLSLPALALFVLSARATLAVDYQPITGVSQDGTCGNGVTCVGSGYGGCCNADGVCGDTDEHCGDGCQPLFGYCPVSILNKRDLSAEAELSENDIVERALEKRAATSACTSAATTSITCVPSKTSIIKSAEANPTSFCSSWNANKPHSNSPFVTQGILSPVGVSEACSCILANAGTTKATTTKTTTASTAKKTSTTTKKTSTTTKKITTTTKATTTSAVAADKVASSCVASYTSLVRTNRPSTDSWCKTWLAQRPHSLSPFPKIPSPLDVSNACSCIIAADSASTTSTCVATNTALVRKNRPSTDSWCQTWLAERPHSLSPFPKISTPLEVTNACLCILSADGKTVSATSTKSACSLKKRRRRDIHLATPVPSV